MDQAGIDTILVGDSVGMTDMVTMEKDESSIGLL